MKIPRLGYWLSVIGISVAILALGATELVLFVATAIYLLVAALRMRDMGNNPWWCLTALIPFIGLWVFLWLGFAKSRVAEVGPTEGVPGDEHEATVQAQNSNEGSTDRQRDQNAPQDVRRHQTTAKPVFVRQQPQRSERPFRPPETPSPGNRPTADEWFAVTSSEEPAGNDEQFEIEPSEEPANNEDKPKRQAKPILIGAGVLTLLGVATIATLSALIMTGDSPILAKCDTWLQEQLVTSREATTNVENVNAVVAAIQDQRAADCSPISWNPLVTNVSRDHKSNIDVRFSTAGGISRGATVTTTTEGAPRWFYLADENRWYSPAEDSPPILAAPPTGTTPPQPPPATARPVHTPRPPVTVSTPPTPITLYPTPSPSPTNAVAQGQVQFIEVGGDDSFSGQAATEFEKGKDLLQQENYHGALQAFQSAQVHHGKPSSVLETQIGMVFRRLDDHQQAIVHFTKAIGIKDNPVGRVNRALSYIEISQCPLTFQDAKRVLDMEPESANGFHTHAEAHAALSACHQTSGDNASAIEHAKAALPLMEENHYSTEVLATAHVSAGDAYTLEKRYAKATQHYSQSIELNNNAAARAGRAWNHQMRQNCNDALADAGEAIKLTPVSRHGYHSSAEAYWLFVVCLGEADQRATQHVQSALHLMEQSGYSTEEIAVYNVWGGNTFYNHKRYPDAIEHYSRAIDLDETAQARVGRARAHLKVQDCSKALVDSRKALQMPNESWTHYRSRAQINSWAEAHVTLSHCYTDQSQWGEALQHAESALMLMQENRYDAAKIASAEELIKNLQSLNQQPDPADVLIRARYSQEGERLNATRSPTLVWADGSNWVDGVSHQFPAIPIVHQTPIKFYLTCAQREALKLATGANNFANHVWGNHPNAPEWNTRNPFANDCGSQMQTK